MPNSSHASRSVNVLRSKCGNHDYRSTIAPLATTRRNLLHHMANPRFHARSYLATMAKRTGSLAGSSRPDSCTGSITQSRSRPTLRQANSVQGLHRESLDGSTGRMSWSMRPSRSKKLPRSLQIVCIISTKLLTDFVIMPNHVHILVAFPDQDSMLYQCESWKHFTAREINRILGRSSRYWQQDAFDHLLRSEQQYRYLREYVAKNPEKARLKRGEYLHYQRKGVQ